MHGAPTADSKWMTSPTSTVQNYPTLPPPSAQLPADIPQTDHRIPPIYPRMYNSDSHSFPAYNLNPSVSSVCMTNPTAFRAAKV